MTKETAKLNLFEKEKEYTVKVDLDKLSGGLLKYMSTNGWTVQSAKTDHGMLIQATKGGILRELFAASRALNILFTDKPNGLKVEIGIGKWFDNITTTIIEAAILSTLFLVVDIPEMLWNVHIENAVMKEIDNLVDAQSWKLVQK